ncbi:50S ribosomal protein L30 [archaeon]|nr:50S ribosomal protein L30 [archaeon]|tara:strand:+ start:1034 stop:1504 length:471 start_codon:yes stop_codon:yes gene_type:complete
MKLIAIIRLKGKIGLKRPVKDTFKLLRLYKLYYCIILKNTPMNVGMIERVKDATTWGEIDEKTLKELLLKRGRLPANKRLTQEYLKEKTELDTDKFVKEIMEDTKTIKSVPGLKPFFRLKPPTGGFERKGIKQHFAQGGSIGYRKEKINELLMKML